MAKPTIEVRDQGGMPHLYVGGEGTFRVLPETRAAAVHRQQQIIDLAYAAGLADGAQKPEPAKHPAGEPYVVFDSTDCVQGPCGHEVDDASNGRWMASNLNRAYQLGWDKGYATALNEVEPT